MKRHFILLLLAPLLFQSCICSTDPDNRGDVNLISVEDEWEMGRQLSEELNADLPLVDDPRLTGYVEHIGEQIVRQSGLAHRPWRFHVVADPAINAFAIAGGHVYVNTGLIAAASSSSELAGVVSHEVAHVIARHHSERLTKAYGLDWVARLVLGDNPGLLRQLAAQVLGSGAMAKFSRDDEREADRLGLGYLPEAGYDPGGMVDMFETLLEQRERTPGALERFFSTHPMTEERIEDLRALTDALPPTPAEGDSAEYERIRKRAAAYARPPS